jgi:hypothetical protein
MFKIEDRLENIENKKNGKSPENSRESSPKKTESPTKA